MMRCSFDGKIQCIYLENENGVQVRGCDGCTHYPHNRVRATGGLPELDDGWKAIGCLFIGLLLSASFLAIFYFAINAFRR